MEDNEARLSSLHLPPSRTSAGRKLETWSVGLPKGKADIVVTIHVTQGDMFFRATPEGHPALLGLIWEGTDLSTLRSDVSRDIEVAARRYYRADWAPGFSVSGKWHEGRHDGNSRQIELKIEPIHIAGNQTIGNQGETRVLSGGRDMTLHQRGHRQRFEYGKNLEKDNMRLSREDGETVSRAIVGAEHAEQVVALQVAFGNMGDALLERLSADRVKLDGLPGREELARLLSRAILDPEPVTLPDRSQV